MKRQQGLVLIFALLILAMMTVVAIGAVKHGVLQMGMSKQYETSTIAFEAAETAIEAAVFESEDSLVVNDAAMQDPLAEARGKSTTGNDSMDVSCGDSTSNLVANRSVGTSGVVSGAVHATGQTFTTSPVVKSWSKTIFLREVACKGFSNVIGGSKISCHLFAIKGCGKLDVSHITTANTMTAAVLAPASGTQD